MKTLRDLAVQALEVQNASNPLGLSHGFHEAMIYLRDTGVKSTSELLAHPIYRLWVMKFADLGGITVEPEQFANAFDQTSAIAFGVRADVPGISDELASRLACGDCCTDAMGDPDDETVLDEDQDDDDRDYSYREFIAGLESEQSEPVVGRCWPQ